MQGIQDLLDQSIVAEPFRIKDALDEGLPRAYTKDIYQTKCNALFEHVYESYLGDGQSVFVGSA